MNEIEQIKSGLPTELTKKIRREKDRLRELESQCRRQKEIVANLVAELQETCPHHCWAKNSTGYRVCMVCGQIGYDWIL